MTEDTTTTALAVRPAVLPTPAQFEMMRAMAERLAFADGFLPKHFFLGDPRTRPHRVLAAIEYGRAVGIEPMVALQNITMIDGKAGASALLIGALLRRAGYSIETVYAEDNVGNPISCRIMLSKAGAQTGEGKFTMQDAKRAGLVREGSGWVKYPRDMLYARALTQAARQGAQDAMLGMAYTAEELGAEVDEDGQVASLPAAGAVIDGEVVPAVAPGVSEAVGSPTTTAIQPTPPAPSAEVVADATPRSREKDAETGAPATPPPTSQKRSARSVGPQAKRTNVIPAPQAPAAPVTAIEEAAGQLSRGEIAPGAVAPSGLTDEPVPAPVVDEGERVYTEDLRQALRTQAAVLSHLNAVVKNTLVHPLKNEPLEVVPPVVPSALSDANLQNLIERDYPGQTLATLTREALENRLELIEPFIAKRREQLAEKGIPEQ